jgi:hypothetical protein
MASASHYLCLEKTESRMKKLLSALLVIWMLLIVIGGIAYMTSLGKHITGNGPQALTGDGSGGFFLVAQRQILHFDAQEKLLERHDFDALGLQDVGSILFSNKQLLAFDNERKQIFRCMLPAWQCAPFSPATLDLSQAIAMAWQTPGTLVISDNTGHRLLMLDAQGRPLYTGPARWHYPNQITSIADGLMLADTDRNVIVHLADAESSTPEILLETTSRPYQFVRRDNSWWVLQAGVLLENAELFHYHHGIPEKISITAQDPTALLDTGRRIIIASRQDWELLSLDPETGNAIPAGDKAFQAELNAQHLATQTAKKQRGRLPYIMLALMLPALLGGVVLQRRLDAEKSAPVMTSAIKRTAPEKTASHVSVRIDTDKSRIEMQRLEQNRLLLKSGLIVIPLLILLALFLWFSGIDLAGLTPVFFLIAALLVLTPLLVYRGRRKQDRLFDQQLVCGPQKLVHIKQGKPVGATPYADIWLGSDTMLLKEKTFPLYIGLGKLRAPFWMVHDIQREIGKRIPPEQLFNTDHEMGRAMLGRNKTLGLRLIFARYAVAIAIALVLLLKLFQVLHHLHLDKLWKIFHPN